MRKSGYRSTLHIYFIFLTALLCVTIFAALFSLSIITVHTPGGSAERSSYPKEFTVGFQEQIVFTDNTPRIKQSGLELLQSNHAGIQILNDSGQEIVSYQKPEDFRDSYSYRDLLEISETGHINDSGTTSFVGALEHNGKDYTYIVHFPVNIAKVTMYMNGDRFTAGKQILFLCLGVMFLTILIAGFIYGFRITNIISRLSHSIQNIAQRSYIPTADRGAFRDLFDSLDHLDAEIKASDKVAEETENLRKEWISNITHDLKTPLSPIKGYAEMLSEKDIISEEQVKKYSQVMLKNVSYMESLINDLKLTYQLDSGMVPIQNEHRNIVRFLKELVIDILNNPEYENREIHFDCPEEEITLFFDSKLMTRAFQNLILNAFAHGNEDTEITLRIAKAGSMVQIIVSDNGNGIKPEEANRLFQRYYRGTNTEQKTAGTGLGLAITRSIIEAQGGSIMVESELGIGTDFKIYLGNG